MKKILILLLLFGVLGACKKDEPVVIKDQLSLLPTATQRGANTAGCLVDGQAFLGNREVRTPLSLDYLDGEDFALSIQKKENGIGYSVRVVTNNIRLEVGKTYPLNNEFLRDVNAGEYIISSTSFPDPRYHSTNPNVTGEVTITAHNFDKAFLSGTFWFDAVNSEGKIVEIREGRFDMDY